MRWPAGTGTAHRGKPVWICEAAGKRARLLWGDTERLGRKHLGRALLRKNGHEDKGTADGIYPVDRVAYLVGTPPRKPRPDKQISPRSFPSWEASSADFLVYIVVLQNNAPVTRIFSHDLSACCGGNVDLVRVYCIAGRLSILIAGLWKSTGINLREFLRRLASLFCTANAN